MKLRIILAATALGAVAVPGTAMAQTTRSRGTVIGGVAPSFLELILSQPATASMTTFSKPKTYAANFDVGATTTDETAVLTLADGEVASGSKLGHSRAAPRSCRSRSRPASARRPSSGSTAPSARC